MRRVVSVWLPTLPTDRIRPPQAGKPLVTVARDGNSRVLAAVDAVASAQGLRAGMKLAQAEAQVADLAVHEADPAGDAETLRQLAAWCLRYAPLTAPDQPDGLWIDATGSTHLAGGETRLLRDLEQRLGDQALTGHRLTARAAIAETPAAAHAMARFGARPMADLPIEALRLPARMLTSLHQLGFQTIGRLAATPRGPLVRRFGKALALRLDQAAGTVFEPIVPVVPRDLIQSRLGFVEPLLTPEAFNTVIERLVSGVCVDLEHTGQGARRLDLLFERVDGSTQAIRIGTAKPTREASHISRMLRERLDRVDPGLGVEAMRLVVAVADKLAFMQASTIDQTGGDIAPLVDVLINRLGESRVYRIAPVESHVPERTVRPVPALAVGKKTWPATLPRPVRLLHRPQPVEAMALLPDHPPVTFTWRQVRHRVRHATGPERIGGEWWKREPEMVSLRDYFHVEDEAGRRFWLFRRGNGADTSTGDMRWFLHGFF